MDIIESSCLSGDGNLRFGQCGDDGWHCTEVGMALLGGSFHELLFHVGDVSDDLCAWHSRIGGEVETGIFFHRHGDHGWGTGTEVDGLGGGCEGDVVSISCADGMFCGGGSVWIRLAEAERKSGVAGEGLRSSTKGQKVDRLLGAGPWIRLKRVRQRS